MRSIVIILFLLSGACTAQSSKRAFKTFEHNGQQISYAIQLPGDFEEHKTYPVAIGPSEVQSSDDQSFYWRGTSDTYGWILVDFPIYGSTKKTTLIKAFMDHLRATYKVEGDKFHTVCFSANSAGIFDLVMAIPEGFHSITGIAGNPGTRDIAKLAALKGVNVSFVVGDKDTYWMNAAKDRHERLLEAGVDSQIEIIKDGKHVLSELIGKGMVERMDKLRNP